MGLLINFPQYGKMKQNLWYEESLRNWYLYYSYSMCAFFPIRFSFYGILYHMGNACVFSSNFHNMGKDSQTHQMVKPEKLFPSNILQKASNVENLENFYSHFPHSMQDQKSQRNLLNEEGLGNWLPYFFHKIGEFFSLDFHPVVYFLIWEMHDFSHQFLIALERTGTPIEWEKPRKLVPGKVLQNPSYVENLGNWY